METTEFVKAMNEPICKLIDHISNGIGIAYEPHRIKKMADAEAYRIGVLGKAISENDNLPIQYNGEKLFIDATQYEEMQKRAAARFVHQETQRQFNIENIADKAYDLLQDVTDCSKESVSDDWIARFITTVQDVSDEDVQNMWAKILAGEIQQPGSLSMRTLDVLKNLSKNEAEAFQTYLPFVMIDSGENAFITCEPTITEKYSMNGNLLFKLNSCGLLQVIPFSEFNVIIPSDGNSRRFYTKERLLTITNMTSKQMDMKIRNIYLLTEAGRELYNFLYSEPNNDYFEDWVKQIYKNEKMKGLKFSIHDKIPNTDNQYSSKSIITFENKIEDENL